MKTENNKCLEKELENIVYEPQEFKELIENIDLSGGSILFDLDINKINNVVKLVNRSEKLQI